MLRTLGFRAREISLGFMIPLGSCCVFWSRDRTRLRVGLGLWEVLGYMLNPRMNGSSKSGWESLFYAFLSKFWHFTRLSM